MNKIIISVKRALHPKNLRNKWLNIVLRGNEVECPCCGASFITFVPAGLQRRANARCVNCQSLERHRALWLYFKNDTNLFSGKLKVLHVAPEKLFYKKLVTLANIEYYAIDKYPDKYDYNKKTVEMDLTDLQFNDNEFDVIICNHVLEHVPDDTKAMREMYRVLKPGGWAVINVPVDKNRKETFEDIYINDPKKQLELFGQSDHVRVYGMDYFDRLKTAGFNTEIIDYFSKFSHNESFRYGMQQKDEIYKCWK